MLFFQVFIKSINRPFRMCCMKYFTKSFLYYQQGHKSLKKRICLCKKGKDSHSLVAVAAVAVRVHHVLGTAYERGSPSLSFCCFYPSLIRKRYPFTAGSTDEAFQPQAKIEPTTFNTVVKGSNHFIAPCLHNRDRLLI